MTDTIQRYIDRIKELEAMVKTLQARVEEQAVEIENIYEDMAGEDI